MRWILLSSLVVSGLQAEGIPEEQLGAIYSEALWFVGVVSVMAVASFVISSRNAKKYEEKLAQEKRQERLGKREKREESTGKRKEKREKRKESLGKSEVERETREEESGKRKEENEKRKGDESDSSVDRLLELSKLHKEGLLSKEEFMTFKTELYRELKGLKG